MASTSARHPWKENQRSNGTGAKIYVRLVLGLAVNNVKNYWGQYKHQQEHKAYFKEQSSLIAWLRGATCSSSLMRCHVVPDMRHATRVTYGLEILRMPGVRFATKKDFSREQEMKNFALTTLISKFSQKERNRAIQKENRNERMFVLSKKASLRHSNLAKRELHLRFLVQPKLCLPSYRSTYQYTIHYRPVSLPKVAKRQTPSLSIHDLLSSLCHVVHSSSSNSCSWCISLREGDGASSIFAFVEVGLETASYNKQLCV